MEIHTFSFAEDSSRDYKLKKQKFWRKWEGKNENKSFGTKPMKKWTEGAVARIYRVFPTDSPTANLNNIIFNYFVGDVSKIRR